MTPREIMVAGFAFGFLVGTIVRLLHWSSDSVYSSARSLLRQG